MSNTYSRIQDKSGMVWKNQRYHQIYEYIDSHVLPPPLNLLIYIVEFIYKIRKLKISKKGEIEYSIFRSK